VDRLWAGWRMAYIEKPRRPSKRKEPCLFCGLQDARPGVKNLLLATSPRALVMLNLYPYNVGHVMVAPREHVGTLARLGSEDQVELGEWLGRVETALRLAYRPHGFNVGMNLGRTAGAGVLGHLHWHVVPRWNGDTNFMPVTATTKVLPEPLDRTYRRIAEALASTDAAARRRKRPGGR
jgi:ATP adenylyltransferase